MAQNNNIKEFYKAEIEPLGSFGSEQEFTEFISDPKNATDFFEAEFKDKGIFGSSDEFVDFIGVKKKASTEPIQPDLGSGGTVGASGVQSTESKKIPSPVSLIAQMQEKAIKDSGEQTKQEIKASNLTPVELRTISDRLVQSVNTAKQKQFPLEIPDPELKTKAIPQPKDELLSKFNQDAIAGVEDNVKLILKEDPKLQDKTRKGFLSDAEQFEIVEKAISRNMINANNGIDILNARGINKIIESYAKDTEEVNKIGSELNIMASEMETLKKDNKINEFNKLVPQYNEKIKQYQQQSKSIEKYKEYEPQIKEYYGYIEQYNNGLKQLTEAKSKYPTLELAEKAQKVANTEFYESTFGKALDLGATATNSIVDAFKGLFTSGASIAADIGETLDPSLRKQYKPSDAFVDFMDRTITKPFLTKESIDSKFINPNTGNINWGVYPALKSVANNVGFTTMLALTGRATTPMLTRQFAASAPTLTASLNAANKAKVWTTVLPAYMGVYTQNSKEADEMGLTGAKKLAYVNIISGLEGVSELIMPDQDLIMPNLKQRLLKDFVKDYAKGKTFAVKNLVLGIAENAVKEQIEELMVMAGKNLTTAVYNIADGETKVYVPTVGEFVETMMVAGVIAGAMTAPTKLIENAQFRKVALYKMATNYEASKAILDQINPSNKQQILEEMQVFQTQIGKLPNDVSDIKKAEIALRLNEISEINKQNENPELSDTIKKVNEKRVSELEKEIYGIITDKEYDARYAEEMNKLATETISEDPITIEEDAETDGTDAKVTELEAELKQLASGTVTQEGEAGSVAGGEVAQKLGEPQITEVEDGQLFEWKTKDGLIGGVLISPTEFRIDGISANEVGKGLGSKMFENLIDYLKEKGVKIITTKSAGEGAITMHDKAVKKGLLKEISKDGRNAIFEIISAEPAIKETSKAEATAEVKKPIAEMKGESVTVNLGGKAISGIVEVDEGGKAQIFSGNQIFELPADVEYSEYVSPVRLADNVDGIEVNGEVYAEVRFEVKDNQEVALLIKEDGTLVTMRVPAIVEELKYQSALAQMEEMGEQELNQIYNTYESERKTTPTAEEGVSETDGTAPAETEQDIRLQEAIEEIDLIEQIALEQIEQAESASKLVQYKPKGSKDAKVYLVTKNADGSYSATVDGKKVVNKNVLSEIGKKYEATTKQEVNSLIPKLQEQTNNLKQEVENKLFGVTPKTEQDAVQKQTTSQVPIQPKAEDSGKVEEGTPEAKPKIVAKKEKIKVPHKINKFGEKIITQEGKKVLNDLIEKYQAKTPVKYKSSKQSLTYTANVVNEQNQKLENAKTGNPITVRLLHGTRSIFDKFSKDFLGAFTGSKSAEKATFLTASPQTASSYANTSMNVTEYQKEIINHLSEVTDMTFEDVFDIVRLNEKTREPSFVISASVQLKNPLVVDNSKNTKEEIDIDGTITQAIKDGHDGVIFLNTPDAFATIREDFRGNHVAVFNTENITEINVEKQFNKPEIVAEEGKEKVKKEPKVIDLDKKKKKQEDFLKNKYKYGGFTPTDPYQWLLSFFASGRRMNLQAAKDLTGYNANDMLWAIKKNSRSTVDDMFFDMTSALPQFEDYPISKWKEDIQNIIQGGNGQMLAQAKQLYNNEKAELRKVDDVFDKKMQEHYDRLQEGAELAEDVNREEGNANEDVADRVEVAQEMFEELTQEEIDSLEAYLAKFQDKNGNIDWVKLQEDVKEFWTNFANLNEKLQNTIDKLIENERQQKLQNQKDADVDAKGQADQKRKAIEERLAEAQRDVAEAEKNLAKAIKDFEEDSAYKKAKASLDKDIQERQRDLFQMGAQAPLIDDLADKQRVVEKIKAEREKVINELRKKLEVAKEKEQTVQQLLDDNIKGQKSLLDRLDDLKIKGSDQTGVLMLAPKLFNGFIDAIKAGIKAGMILGDAIKKGIDYLKANGVTDVEPYLNEIEINAKEPNLKREIQKLIKRKPTEQKRIDKAYAWGVADTFKKFNDLLDEMASDFKEMNANTDRVRKELRTAVRESKLGFTSQQVSKILGIVEQTTTKNFDGKLQELKDYLETIRQNKEEVERKAKVKEVKSDLNPKSYTSLGTSKRAKTRISESAKQQLISLGKAIGDQVETMSLSQLNQLQEIIDNIVEEGKQEQSAIQKFLENARRIVNREMTKNLSEKAGRVKPISGKRNVLNQLKDGNLVIINGNIYAKRDASLLEEQDESYFNNATLVGTVEVNQYGTKRPSIKSFIYRKTDFLTMLNALMPKGKEAKQWFESNIINPIVDASNSVLEDRVKFGDKIIEAKTKAFGKGKSAKILSKQTGLALKDINGNDVVDGGITNDMAVYIYNVLKDPLMIDKAFNSRFNKDQLIQIINYVNSNPQLKKYAEEVVNLYKDYLPKVNNSLIENGYDSIVPGEYTSLKNKIAENSGQAGQDKIDNITTEIKDLKNQLSVLIDPLEITKKQDEISKKEKALSNLKNSVESINAKAEIMEAIYGDISNMPLEIPYTPARVGAEVGQEFNMDDMFSTGRNVVSAMADNVIERTKGGSLRVIGNEQMMESYRENMINMANKLTLYRNLFSMFQQGQQNMRLIESMYGSKFAQDFQGLMQDIVMEKNTTKVPNNWVIDYVNRSAGLTMFFNLRSAVFQLLSMPNYMVEAMRDGVMIDATANFFKQFTDAEIKDAKREIMESGWFRDRINRTHSPELDDLRTAKGKSLPTKALDDLIEKGYFLTQLADSYGGIMMGGAPYYASIKKKLYNENLSKGMSSSGAMEKAKKDAMDKMSFVSNKTQQSQVPLYMSEEQKNPISRMFLTFGSVNALYTREMIRAISDYKNKRISAKEAVGVVAYYAVAQQMVFLAIQQGLTAVLASIAFSDDEEEKLKEIQLAKKKSLTIANQTVNSFLRGFGVYGAGIAAAKDLVADITALLAKDTELAKEYKDLYTQKRDKIQAGIDFINQLAPNVGIKINKAIRAVRDLEKYQKEQEVQDLVKGVAKGTEAVTNVPTGQLVRVMDYIQDMQNDYLTLTEKIMYLMLDYETLKEARDKQKKEKSTTQQGSTLGRVIETTDRQATERQTNERQATSRQAE